MAKGKKRSRKRKRGGKAAPEQPGSNWEKLQKILGRGKKDSDAPSHNKKPKSKASVSHSGRSGTGFKHFKVGGGAPASKAPKKKRKKTQCMNPRQLTFPLQKIPGEATDIVAMDCEMVGVGVSDRSVLARCSIVNVDGHVVYDQFVRPKERISNFRTKYSGVTAKRLKKAVPFAQAVKEVASILDGRVVVGHALHNDFEVLLMHHPPHLVRDTSRFKPFQRVTPTGRARPRKLQHLASEFLGVKGFQAGEHGHDSVDDAVMALELYKLFKMRWEREISREVKKANKQKRKHQKKKPSNTDGVNERSRSEDALYGL